MSKELWFLKTSDGTRTIVTADPDPSKQNPYDPSADFPAGGDFVVRVAGRSAPAVMTIPAPVVTGGSGLALSYDPIGLFTITPATGYTPSGVTQTWEAFKNGISIGPVAQVFDPGNLETATGDWYVIEKADIAGYQPKFTTSATLTLLATSPYPWMVAGEWVGAEATSDADTRLTEVSTLLDPPEGKVWAAHRKTTTYGAALANDFPGELVVMPFDGVKYGWKDTVQRTKGAAEYCRIAIGDLVDVSGGILTNGVWAVDEKTFTVSNDPLALGTGDWSVATADNGFTITLTNPADGRGRAIQGYTYAIDGVDQGALPGGLAMGARFISRETPGSVSVTITAVNANGSATSAGKSVSPTIVTPTPGTLVFNNGSQQLTFTNVLALVEHVDGVLAVVVAPGQSATLTAKTPAPVGTSGSTVRNGQRINPEHFDVSYMDGRLSGARNPTALPAVMSIGQTMLSGASRPNTETNPRSGLIDNMLGIYVTDTMPNPLSLGPLIVWRSTKGALTTPSVVDYDAIAATLPTTYSVSGGSYRSQTNARRNLRFNPGYGINNRDASTGGYEECLPYRWGNTSRSATNHNYDEDVMIDVGDFMLHLCANTAQVSLATKAEILKRLDSVGWQTEQGIILRNLSIIMGGSHHQTPWFCVAIHHWLRGNYNALSSNWTRFGGAQRACFRWNADRLSFWQGPYGTPGNFSGLYETFGTAGERPAYGIRRAVAAVNAGTPSVTIPAIRTGPSVLYGDNAKARYPGMRLYNETTGENVLITAQTNVNVTDGTTGGDIPAPPKVAQLRFAIDAWPSLGFTVGDTVYLAPHLTPALDDPDWRLAGDQFPNSYSASDEMPYRQSQRWFAGQMFFRVLGMHRTEWQTAWDYGIAAMGSAPSGAENWPKVVADGGLADNFWTQHQTAILAVAQPYL